MCDACFADGLPVVKEPLYEMTLGVSACRQKFPRVPCQARTVGVCAFARGARAARKTFLGVERPALGLITETCPWPFSLRPLLRCAVALCECYQPESAGCGIRC